MVQIKLICLNVETNKHWYDIIPFIQKELPEVLCLQEVFESDVKMLEEKFSYQSIFLPMCKRKYDDNNIKEVGIAILTNLKIESKNSIYYYKPTPEIKEYDNKTLQSKRESIFHGVVTLSVKKDKEQFTFANTHFTWTPDGMPNAYQEQDVEALLKALSGIPEMILCGDFNAPRGENIIYKKLIDRFKDDIPKSIETTLDIDKHRASINTKEKKRIGTYIVDYIFSTPEYYVSKVKLQLGLSDHAALIADVQLANSPVKITPK